MDEDKKKRAFDKALERVDRRMTRILQGTFRPRMVITRKTETYVSFRMILNEDSDSPSESK